MSPDPLTDLASKLVGRLRIDGQVPLSTLPIVLSLYSLSAF